MSSDGFSMSLPIVFDTAEIVTAPDIPPSAATDHSSQNAPPQSSSSLLEISPTLHYDNGSLDEGARMAAPDSHDYNKKSATATVSTTNTIGSIRDSYEDVLALLSAEGSALAPLSPTPVEQAISPPDSMDGDGDTHASTARDGFPLEQKLRGGSESLDQADTNSQIHPPPAGDERPESFAHVQPEMVWVKQCLAVSALPLFLALIRFAIPGIFEVPGTTGAEGLGEMFAVIAAMGASQIDSLLYWWWRWKVWHKPYTLARQLETTIPENTHAEPAQSFGVARNEEYRGSTATHELTNLKDLVEDLTTRIDQRQLIAQDYWAEHHPNEEFDLDQLIADIDERIQNQPNPSSFVKSIHLNFKELQQYLSQRDILVNPLNEGFQYDYYADENDNFPQTRHDGARFHAILIGIDDYMNSPFQGSVNDANLMHKICMKAWGVPEEQITLLTSDNHDPTKLPTRENILIALYALRDIAAIAEGDNIIFYFSGHGTRYDAAEFFKPSVPQERWIEAICPMDRGCGDADSPVLDISDRELNIIVSEICAETGCHASIIVDTCHSGGVARAMEEFEGLRRLGALKLSLGKMLLSADEDPRRRKSSKRAASDAWVADQSKCVYMAACRQHERAYERELGPKLFHGLFTYSLVRFLKSDSTGMTYAELEKKLGPLPLLRHDNYQPGLQNPYFTGERKGCKLFSNDG